MFLCTTLKLYECTYFFLVVLFSEHYVNVNCDICEKMCSKNEFWKKVLKESIFIFGLFFQLYTLTQIDSKSASEESHVCIAIASLYISLSGLSWCYLKVTGPLWKKMLIEKNLSYGNILKIKISLVKLWFSKCYHRINFFYQYFFPQWSGHL